MIADVTGKDNDDVVKGILLARKYSDLKFQAANKSMASMLIGAFGGASDSPLTQYEEAPGDFYLVDINEVMSALKYHPEMKAKILAARDKPVQADTVAPVAVASGDAIPNSVPGTVTRWTLGLIKEAREMRDKLKAEGIKDYAARTAAHYKVAPSRLRDILLKNPPPIQQDANNWMGTRKK